ncbi:MAG: DUF2309 domain-containing protein [Pseudomonadota bacterium]
MNITLDPQALQDPALRHHIQIAASRVAPTWPLDEFIAVNPYWGWVGHPIEEAAATLGTLAGTRLTMPRTWFREQWVAGRLKRSHLEAVVTGPSGAGTHGAQPQQEAEVTVEDLVAALEGNAEPLARLPLITELRDQQLPPRPGITWSDLVTHQVSQHCAAFFDRQQARWEMDTSSGLYESWRMQVGADHGLPWRQGRAALHARVAQMPNTPTVLIGTALHAMGLPEEAREAYLSAVLMAIGGWGAWCAYERWQARLRGADNDNIEHLLAIRLAWEWLLFEDAAPGTLPRAWAEQWANAGVASGTLQRAQRIDWLLQGAVEIAFQQPLIEGLGQPLAPTPAVPVAVQALFCIDVRSEVFRRALEAVSPAIQTCGFAGFFGLPIAYSPFGSALTRPQLPGLLAPTQYVSERVESQGLGQVLVNRRKNALQWRQRWAEFRASPSSAFSFVETMGLTYGAKLISESLPSSHAPARWEDTGLPPKSVQALRPCITLAATDPVAAAAMAKSILCAMGLVSGFAPLVMLAGHGSQSVNNPHASGLDCGACGGQSGEVNARVLADLLNKTTVRNELRQLGIDIPAGTHFLPALHNTTTDQVVLYDTDDVPENLTDSLAELRRGLEAAGEHARAERAESLGLDALAGHSALLKAAVRERANDWAQVRPEWGLANNAAFIVAPRARSRQLNMAGRTFLHDYDHKLDPDLVILTLIMTAPMIVTHWINMQYHASTVDNRRYGSGNKVLHNVVGGHLGVFEGNGGDLRIGLPIQSLHDGRTLRHTPLRLSVFIEAPRAAIDTVMAGHEIIRLLAGNGWLHLFRIDAETAAVEQYHRGAWKTAYGA